MITEADIVAMETGYSSDAGMIKYDRTNSTPTKIINRPDTIDKGGLLMREYGISKAANGLYIAMRIGTSLEKVNALENCQAYQRLSITPKARMQVANGEMRMVVEILDQ